MTRPHRFAGLLLVFLLTSCGGEVKVATPAPPEYTAGISYTNYVVPQVPWSIHVARITRSGNDLEFYSAHARGAALGLATLSEQIRSLKPELGIPVAAVNGDFYVREKAYAGDPRGLQIRQGELLSAPVGGVSFWIDTAGQPHVAEVTSLFKVVWPNGTSNPFGLNEERRTGKSLVLYTPAVASTHTTNGVELVLEQAEEGPWLPLRLGMTYPARIREVRARGNTSVASNTLVLSIGPSLRGNLPALEPGAVLKISTETSPDLREVKTAIGGGPVLIHEGRRQKWKKPVGEGLVSYALTSMKERHPRTALGWDEKYFYLVEVDGRQKRLSVGMTLNELANFMISMGCKEAVNFDGGGSATFWCNGRIVNSPCDKRERDIANSLLVLRKPGTQSAATVSRFQPGGRPPQ